MNEAYSGTLKDFLCKPGDAICTYKKRSWLSEKIFWFSKWNIKGEDRFPIAHIALFLGYKEGVPWVSEAMPKGITKSKATCYNKSIYIIHVARPIGLKQDESFELQLLAYAKAREGTPYAYLQLLGEAIQRVFRIKKIGDWDKHALICSEYYVRAMKDLANINIMPGRNPGDTTPLEIYASDRMEAVMRRDAK